MYDQGKSSWSALIMRYTFTAVFEQHGPLWIATVEELPGVQAEGKTIEETREHLRAMIQKVIATNRQLAKQDADGRMLVREPIQIIV